MCFSEEVSLSTFFIGTIFGYLAIWHIQLEDQWTK